jgi:hypothetical protein
VPLEPPLLHDNGVDRTDSPGRGGNEIEIRENRLFERDREVPPRKTESPCSFYRPLQILRMNRKGKIKGIDPEEAESLVVERRA